MQTNKENEEKQKIITKLSKVDPVYELFAMTTYMKNYWVRSGKYIDEGYWDSEKLMRDFTVDELHEFYCRIIYCADIDFSGDACDPELWDKLSLAELKQFLRGEYHFDEENGETALKGFPILDDVANGG